MLDFRSKFRIQLFQLSSLLNFIDLFLPDDDYGSFDGINLRRRCRLVVGICGLSGLFCLVITVISILLNGAVDITDPITIVLGCLVLLNPFIMRKTGRIELAGWLFVIEICTLTILPSILLGGIFAPNTLFLILLPLVGGFFLNSTSGIYIAATAIVAISGLFIFNETLQEWKILTTTIYDSIFYVCFLFALLLCTGLGWLFEQSQKTATVEMAKVLKQLQRAHAELVAARNEAEAANQAKSAFLATMSHEIRTPLNGVIGMTGLLLDTQLSGEQQEFVQVVRNSGESLLSIINDILDFSKIEAGKIDLEEAPFNLRNCVEDALALVAVKANEKGLELLHNMPATTPIWVAGDVTRLRQILLNLLSNAVKFTNHGEVVVSVDAELLDNVIKNNDRVEDRDSMNAPMLPGVAYKFTFQVSDTGIGIPPERMDRLFKSFSQIDASTTRQYGGTGLGLAISKKLSEVMGGTMWVESSAGEGSTFHFSIVLTLATEQHTTFALDNNECLIDMNILVIDDNATNRKILTHQLEAWGMLPTAVSSGTAALQLLNQAGPFRLVIADMQTLDVDGLTIIEKIRSKFSSRGLPVILLTSIDHIARNDWHQLGVFDSITKPVKASLLFDTIVNAISGSKRNRSMAHHRLSTRGQVDGISTSPLGERYPLRILLAEDNLVNQRVALKMLERCGYRADISADGKEAIDATCRQPYDLIFMDVRMPNVDGIQATEYIRNNFPFDKQPVIVALTAEAVQGDKERLLDLGMDHYISKPVNPSELSQLLETIAKQRNEVDPAESL